MVIRLTTWLVLACIFFITLFLSKRLQTRRVGLVFLFRTLEVGAIFALTLSVLYQIPFMQSFVKGVIANSSLLVVFLGFILQNSFKNIIAGFVLSSSNAFKIGDRITLRVRDLTGIVEQIGLRHVVIRTYQNERVIIPNSLLNDEVLINNDLGERISSYPIDILIDREKDIEGAILLIEETIEKNDSLLNKEVKTYCSDIVEDKVNLRTFITTATVSKNFEEASHIRVQLLSVLKEHHFI